MLIILKILLLMNTMLHTSGQLVAFKTPDKSFIQFELLDKQEAFKILTSDSLKLLPQSELDFFLKRAYLLHNDKILYEFSPRKRFFLFSNLKEYRQMIRGITYYRSEFMIDREHGKVFASFDLNSEAAKEFFDGKVKNLDKYPVVDGYRACLLSDGAIAFLRHRISDIYDGYWYPSLQDFEAYYYFLTSDNYAPPKKNNI